MYFVLKDECSHQSSLVPICGAGHLQTVVPVLNLGKIKQLFNFLNLYPFVSDYFKGHSFEGLEPD